MLPDNDDAARGCRRFPRSLGDWSIACRAGVSPFCFGSVLLFRFTRASRRSNAGDVQQNNLGLPHGSLLR